MRYLKISLILKIFLLLYILCVCPLAHPFDGKAMLARIYSDHAIDINNDTFYDFLSIDIGVIVQIPGEFNLMGVLYDSNGQDVAWAVNKRNLSVGYNSVQLNFDGSTIGKRGADGNYRLKDLLLSTGSSDSGFNKCDYILDAYTTSTYDSSQFIYPSIQKHLSGSGIGEFILNVSIKTSVDVFFDCYSYDLVDIHILPIDTFNLIAKNMPGYSYRIPGVFIPDKPNNFTVSASGVKNLNIGLKKDPVKGGINNTRIWVTTQIQSDEKSTATTSSDLLSPGVYHVKIFGDAAENATQVNLTMTLVKKIVVSGPFNLSLNTTGFPDGDYFINLKAINDSFQLNEMALEDLPL